MLPNLFELSLFLRGFTGFYLVLLGFYRVLLDVTESNRVQQNFTGFY